jgi:protein involved in polysaccharide export with SLBB domain
MSQTKAKAKPKAKARPSRDTTIDPSHTLTPVPEADVPQDESLLGDGDRLEIEIKDSTGDDLATREMREIVRKEKCRQRTERGARIFLCMVGVGAVVGIYLKLFILR